MQGWAWVPIFLLLFDYLKTTAIDIRNTEAFNTYSAVFFLQKNIHSTPVGLENQGAIIDNRQSSQFLFRRHHYRGTV
jgi:hypothetical protein